MKKNYIFIKQSNCSYDLELIEHTDVHFWNRCEIKNQHDFQTIYFYCKNYDDISWTLTHHYIPHITFMGDSIFSNFYQQTESFELERFWFPEKKHLTSEFIDQFISLSNIEKTPIAIVFNPMFQSDITYHEFYDFMKKINSQYINPLFTKDLSLQDEEIFSLSNNAIIDGENMYVVLGLFGDYYLKKEPTPHTMHLGILKDKKCIVCDFADSCKERGLGLLKYEQNLSSCVGIKLFQQN